MRLHFFLIFCVIITINNSQFFVGSVELTVNSQCSEPVWLATQPNNGLPDLSDGIVKLDHGKSHTYEVSSTVWARKFKKVQAKKICEDK